MQQRKIQINAHGGADQLVLTSVPLVAPGPGQVRVQHRAVGVNFIDTYHRTGLYPLALPSGLGLEAAGVIDAVGEGVTEFSVGQRVAYCSGPIGAYAESNIVPATNLLPLPDSISEELAAASLLKGLTAAYLLLKTSQNQAGDTVLIHAAAGGVGQILCQWALTLNLRVIATVGRDEKMAVVQQLGCERVINYRTSPWVDWVRTCTNGQGVSVVYDGVGKDTFEDSLRCLMPRGLMVSYGNASGAVEGFSPLLLAKYGSLFLTRPTLADYVRDPAEFKALGSALFDVLQSGKVRPAISHRLPLAQADEAHRLLESGQTTGSVILTVEEK
ncbi:quinone oxidoreductase family protein [Simiduia agarivorans]|uniref:NADPH:quinone reductase n=2 Tax=Simiduia TaxID=447467 RepID=K4KV89_SIMAS|nr:quinone oxidoreductase [Simiduia agarivorans]AFU97862.1 alcohol dehydrogenase, zinc-binding domain containing protein [Simiduia agarivorans SA1 = DSM 21679]